MVPEVAGSNPVFHPVKPSHECARAFFVHRSDACISFESTKKELQSKIAEGLIGRFPTSGSQPFVKQMAVTNAKNENCLDAKRTEKPYSSEAAEGFISRFPLLRITSFSATSGKNS